MDATDLEAATAVTAAAVMVASRLYPFDNFVIMRESFLLRSKLVPYIYTGNFWAYEKGQALLRPLYYAFPESEEAYNNPNQYLFGSDMVVAPITTPSQQYNISR